MSDDSEFSFIVTHTINNVSYDSNFIPTRFKEILSRTIMQEPLEWHVQVSLIYPITLI